ncbi:MAG: hypothetical protein WD208_06585 [Dehalococcoidia bacterium]
MEHGTEAPLWASAIAALGLALVHVLAGNLQSLQAVPRSQWLSAAGGVSVTYVFVHILPELGERQTHLEESGQLGFLSGFAASHIYIVALAGLAVFYGLEHMARSSRRNRRQGGPGEGSPPAAAFWIHIGSFGMYNALIGYLLVHREQPGIESFIFFAVAMGLHFMVNDFGLRDHFQSLYHDWGRWALAAGALAGFIVGTFTQVNDVVVAVLFGFLAGGIIVNVLKEELPDERRSRYRAFIAGAGVYAAVLLFL